ncbi:hypothetical protein N7468_003319 [Penicillium chermesinum]|uniref:WW domain-containing protein n=1 Tax=Penicillium chermesinum TaxID=63820 RepID=A0A9W9P6G7_9EURO|nr:uncharacterized protein N7468_003319 [Penicillium chermesinum]KAJ5238700.1 hypothetical protein N7468_003319 [Penicillium chermesinum]
MSAPYSAPPGPPPPSVPAGWKAQYDEHYKTWPVAVESPPEASVPRPSGSPSEPPPSYESAARPSAIASPGDKKSPMASNNPYNQTNSPPASSGATFDEDARLAAKLQAEENARVRGGSSSEKASGAAADYYSNSTRPEPTAHPGPSTGSPAPEGKRGFFSKLTGKSSSSTSRPPPPRPPQAQYASYGQQPPGGYYGGPNYQQYPQQAGPGYPYPPQGYGGGYGGYPPQRPYSSYQQPPPRRQGGGMGGMGTAGAAALGVGGGLLGGLLIADAVDDFGDHDNYDNDYDDGGDFGGDF